MLCNFFIISNHCTIVTGTFEKKNPKIVGLVHARNESWVIRQCLMGLACYCDSIVFLDDASDDNTLEIAESLVESCHIERIIKKNEWNRDEAGDRQLLLQTGREIGGTHFITIDADELFTANCMDGTLRNSILRLQPSECQFITFYNLWQSIYYYRADNCAWKPFYIQCAFCDDKKSNMSGDFIHTSRIPQDILDQKKFVYLENKNYGLLHFQFVNWRNLLIKQVWYRCLERIRNPNQLISFINERYAPSKNEIGLQLMPIEPDWVKGYYFFDESIVKIKENWREKQILQWFEHYGKSFFCELDIWDVENFINHNSRLIHTCDTLEFCGKNFYSSFFDKLVHWFKYKNAIIFNDKSILNCYKIANFFENVYLLINDMHLYNRLISYFKNIKNVKILYQKSTKPNFNFSEFENGAIIFLNSINYSFFFIENILKIFEQECFNNFVIVLYNFDVCLRNVQNKSRDNYKTTLRIIASRFQIALLDKVLLIFPKNSEIKIDTIIQQNTLSWLY